MLLNFNVITIRIKDNGLQNIVRPATFCCGPVNAVCGQMIQECFEVIDFKTEMTKGTLGVRGVRFIKKLNKRSFSRMQKKTIAFPGIVAKLMGDLHAENTHVEVFSRG